MVPRPVRWIKWFDAFWLQLVLSSESVSSSPEVTLRAGLTLRIIYALFMWASYDPITHDNGPNPMSAHPIQNLAHPANILTQISGCGSPLLQFWISALHAYDSKDDLGGTLVVRAVKGDRGNRIALMPAARLPSEDGHWRSILHFRIERPRSATGGSRPQGPITANPRRLPPVRST